MADAPHDQTSEECDLDRLLAQLVDESISEAEIGSLERLLQNDDARRRYVHYLDLHAELQNRAALGTRFPGSPELSSSAANSPAVIPAATAKRQKWTAWIVVSAAILVLCVCGLVWISQAIDREVAIATLASSENAAWESSLPTTPGSQLLPGTLTLKSGVATIRLHSGAEIVLEAPSQLELISTMRGKLVSGAAVIDVPESATGFVMETPDGYAVDYGTRFAVRVDKDDEQSDFEILEGEVAIHHSQTGEKAVLTGQGKRATVSTQSIVVTDSTVEDSEDELWSRVIRIGTDGRECSVRRDDKRPLNPELLSVKRTTTHIRDLRSFFAFDLSEVNLDQVRSARLRLNLVPSKWGYARLPTVSVFGVYGLTNREKDDWELESRWEEAPGPEDGVLLGTFEVPRSQRTGSFGIQNQNLLDFVREYQDHPVTLIIVRETMVDEVGRGLKHAFASALHPEAVGPMLEFSPRNQLRQ